MDSEQKRQIENQLRVIQLAVDNLIKLLPKEQQMVGSELQRIDMLKASLYFKYVKEIPDNTETDE